MIAIVGNNRLFKLKVLCKYVLSCLPIPEPKATWRSQELAMKSSSKENRRGNHSQQKH